MDATGRTIVVILSALCIVAAAVASSAGLDCTKADVSSSPSCSLLASARRGDVEGVKQAIEQGADINVKDEKARPLLHLMFEHTKMPPTEESETLLRNKKKIAQYLIEKGIDVQARDSFGFSALHRAIHDGRFNEFIDPLIDKGVDPNLAVGELFETPLIVAIDGLNQAAVEQLIKRGANVDKPITDGITPLMFCVLKGDVDSAEILLKHGADINKPDAAGSTPVSMAVRAGRLLTIDLLVREGANLDLRFKEQPSARQAAAKTKHADIRKAFNDAVAKYRKKSASKK